MLDWEWYGNTNVVRVFLHCLLKANYQQRVWQGVTIERGQFITSVASMSAELGLSPKQVRGALMKLERANNLAIKGTNKYSVITICKYDDYQTIESKECKAEREAERQTNVKQNVKQKENKCKQTTSNNNNNNNNNKNTTPNGDSKKFRKPSIEEIRDYILEYGCYWVDAEIFFDYYESNGWKVGRNAMKDWKATIRTWANKDKKVNGDIDLNAEIKYLEQERERMRKQNEEQRKLNL